MAFLSNMTHFSHSGKFWLKTIVFSILLLLLLTFGSLSLLSQLFSPEKLHQAAQDAVSNTGRTIRFDKHIKRTLFPRPTVTLSQVVISKPNSETAAIHIDEMKLGLAWSSLLGTPEIEKWVFIRPEIHLSRQENGNWSLADLLQASSHRPDINRLIIENGEIQFDVSKQLYRMQELNLNIRDASHQPSLTASGTLTSPLLPDFHWQASGNFEPKPNQWHTHDFHFTGSSHFQQHPFNFSIDSQLTWQPEPHQIQLKKLTLTADSPNQQAHLQANASHAEWRHGQWSLAELNAVLTAAYQQADWNGVLNINKLNHQPTSTHIDKLTFNGSRQANGQQMGITLSSAVERNAQQNWQLNNLTLTTRLEQLTGSPRPRFISELNGNFQHQPNGNWQTNLHGLFDNQAATFQANYTIATPKQAAQIKANLQLAQLNLAHYIDALSKDEGLSYPAFLQTPYAPEIEADIAIKTFQLPNLEINDLSTRLMADKHRIVLPDFTAKLYSGYTEGGISMANTQPPSYHLQQFARDIQVRPLMQDLLRYGNISGRGDAVVDITAQGSNHSQLIQSLNGDLQLDLNQGAWMGLDLYNALQGLPRGNLNRSNSESITPFTRFTVVSRFENGIGRHKNAELVSDKLYLTSTGAADLNTLTLNENLSVRPASGQGTPIPINIRGPIHNPSVTVDYSSLTQGLNTPEEKQQALTQALKEQWQWLNPNKQP